MNEILRTRGLVLDKYRVGEWDNFFLILTKDFGRVIFFAKSSQKFKSKLAPHLEPGTISEIYFVERKNREDYLLTGADSVKKPDFSGKTSRQNYFFSQGLSLAKKLASFEVETNEQLTIEYNIVKDYLEAVLDLEGSGRPEESGGPKASIHQDEQKDKRRDNLLFLYQTAYILKLLEQAGFCPDLKICSNCKKKFSKESSPYYDRISGDISCCNEAIAGKNILKLNFDALKLGCFLLKQPYKDIKKLNLDSNTIDTAWRFAINHLKYCLE